MIGSRLLSLAVCVLLSPGVGLAAQSAGVKVSPPSITPEQLQEAWDAAVAETGANPGNIELETHLENDPSAQTQTHPNKTIVTVSTEYVDGLLKTAGGTSDNDERRKLILIQLFLHELQHCREYPPGYPEDTTTPKPGITEASCEHIGIYISDRNRLCALAGSIEEEIGNLPSGPSTAKTRLKRKEALYCRMASGNHETILKKLKSKNPNLPASPDNEDGSHKHCLPGGYSTPPPATGELDWTPTDAGFTTFGKWKKDNCESCVKFLGSGT